MLQPTAGQALGNFLKFFAGLMFTDLIPIDSTGIFVAISSFNTP